MGHLPALSLPGTLLSILQNPSQHHHLNSVALLASPDNVGGLGLVYLQHLAIISQPIWFYCGSCMVLSS